MFVCCLCNWPYGCCATKPVIYNRIIIIIIIITLLFGLLNQDECNGRTYIKQGPTHCRKFRRNLKILKNRLVTWRRFSTADPMVQDATIKIQCRRQSGLGNLCIRDNQHHCIGCQNVQPTKQSRTHSVIRSNRTYRQKDTSTNKSRRVQRFPAWHTKAAINGKCCEGYIVPSMLRLMYQLESVLK